MHYLLCCLQHLFPDSYEETEERQKLLAEEQKKTEDDAKKVSELFPITVESIDRYLSVSLICIYSYITSCFPMVLSYNWPNNNTANISISKTKN